MTDTTDTTDGGWATSVALLASMLGSQYAANRAADQAAEGQQNAINSTNALMGQARNDAIGLFGSGRNAGNQSLSNAIDFYTQGTKERHQPMMLGNVAAQEIVGQGLTQSNNAILGLPVDTSYLAPRQISPGLMPEIPKPQAGAANPQQNINDALATEASQTLPTASTNAAQHTVGSAGNYQPGPNTGSMGGLLGTIGPSVSVSNPSSYAGNYGGMDMGPSPTFSETMGNVGGLVWDGVQWVARNAPGLMGAAVMGVATGGNPQAIQLGRQAGNIFGEFRERFGGEPEPAPEAAPEPAPEAAPEPNLNTDNIEQATDLNENLTQEEQDALFAGGGTELTPAQRAQQTALENIHHNAITAEARNNPNSAGRGGLTAGSIAGMGGGSQIGHRTNQAYSSAQGWLDSQGWDYTDPRTSQLMNYLAERFLSNPNESGLSLERILSAIA